MVKDGKCSSKGSAMDTVESNEESSGNSGASQRSKQLGYFFEKYIEYVNQYVTSITSFNFCLSEFNGELCK